MTHLVPVLRPVLGSPFRRALLYRAAGEIPSWHIAPVRTGTVTDLISGSQIITFTNSSPAWGFNSSGVLVQPTANVPFIEYDPATGAGVGWRGWDAVTNLRSYSEAVLVANGYTATNSTLATQSVSTPIQGVSSASFFALNSGANTGNNTDGMNYFSVSLANSTAYTQSALFKLSGTNTIRLRSNVTGQVFDIVPASGATTPSGAITACTVQAAPNGWYRVSWSFTSTTSVPGNRGDHWCIKTPVADGTTGFWITGTQINLGPLAPYVPTGALTASSTADVASISGAAFAGIWNDVESTVVCRFFSDNTAGSGRISLLFDVGAGGAFGTTGYGSFATLGWFINPATAPMNLSSAVAASAGTKAIGTMAARFKANDSRIAVNGTLGTLDSSCAVPASPTTLSIGRGGWSGSTNYANGYIQELAILKSGRPDPNLTAVSAS
jgi:hypothetical protein